MSALELADKLQNEKAKTFLYVATIVDSANMLRQQQAEIEALKQQYELYGAVWHDEHGYQFTATVGEKVLNDDKWIKLYRKASEK